MRNWRPFREDLFESNWSNIDAVVQFAELPPRARKALAE